MVNQRLQQQLIKTGIGGNLGNSSVIINSGPCCSIRFAVLHQVVIRIMENKRKNSS